MTLTDLCRRAFLGLLGTVLVALGILIGLYSHAFAWVLRRALGVGALLVVALGLTQPARASELGAADLPVGPGAFQITIHDATETLRDYCHRDAAGRIWFSAPNGARFELIASVADPSIVNKGDGSFHPFDAAEVQSALAGVRYDLSRVNADVFILPLPRVGALESAAGPGLILLAPGVLPLARELQHAEFTHELGHVVQYSLMPDRDGSQWNAYRNLRGIEDAAVYSSAAPHACRPHEIFAEDFRALFGDPLANYSHSIENSNLQSPQSVIGLIAFMTALSQSPLSSALVPSANPVRGSVEFVRSGASNAALDLFDVMGRRLATVTPVAVSGGTAWRWDGRSAGQRFAGPVFARMRGEGGSARVTLLP